MLFTQLSCILQAFMAACVFVGWPVKQTLYMWKVTQTKSSQAGTFPRFRVFHVRKFPVISNSSGVYLAQVIRMALVKLSSSLNAKCKKKASTEEQWRTFLSETTYIIKGRPLHPSSNNNWLTPPITPNDILINQNFPPPQSEPEEGSTSGSF